MEKLIELLNEYQKELNEKEGNKGNYEIFERKLNGDSIRMNDLLDPYEGLNMYGGYAKARLISKSFGFIKRLVDSDKIDFEKLEKKVLKEDMIRKFDEGLLMLLAISDNPIEDLISYLK